MISFRMKNWSFKRI